MTPVPGQEGPGAPHLPGLQAVSRDQGLSSGFPLRSQDELLEQSFSILTPTEVSRLEQHGKGSCPPADSCLDSADPPASPSSLPPDTGLHTLPRPEAKPSAHKPWAALNSGPRCPSMCPQRQAWGCGPSTSLRHRTAAPHPTNDLGHHFTDTWHKGCQRPVSGTVGHVLPSLGRPRPQGESLLSAQQHPPSSTGLGLLTRDFRIH